MNFCKIEPTLKKMLGTIAPSGPILPVVFFFFMTEYKLNMFNKQVPKVNRSLASTQIS